MKIAVGGFIHETNTFAPHPTCFTDFGDWLGNGIPIGADIFDRTPKTVALNGFARRAMAAGHDLHPMIHAAAAPANRVERGAYERIVGMMLDQLDAAGPVDAVFLDLHGAMVADHHDDADAEVLRRVRAKIGPDIPLVASLDLHGNVPADMIPVADGLVAYRTYPHVDMFQTGERAYEMLMDLVGDTPPRAHGFRQVPFLMPIHRQSTMDDPCHSIYKRLRDLEAECGVGTKLSLMMGFTLADVAHCGPSLFGYGPDQAALDHALDQLLALVCAQEAEFQADLPSAEVAVAQALSDSSGVTVLADVQDNAGGGATSDTVWIIEALIKAQAKNSVVGLLHDPASAAAAHAAGLSSEIALDLGGKGMPGHSPLSRTFRVVGLHEGPFMLEGPMMKGSDMDLGKMALLEADGVRVVVTSVRTWYVERRSFSIVGAVPEDHQIVAVKSTNHYRADFAPIANRIIEFGAPGAVTLDPTKLTYKNLRPGLRQFGNGPEFHPQQETQI